MTTKKVKEPAVEKKERDAMIAKRDFVISHNGYFRAIKAGDDVSNVPALFHQNLKTEEVI